MPPSEESSAWATLTRAPALGIPALTKALEIFGSARGIIEASDASLERAGLPAAAREFLSTAAAASSSAEREWLEIPGHHVVPFTDPRYPALLRATERHPMALYVAGNVDALNEPQLAIVGSRNPTPQGRDTAHELSEYLAGRGLAITSGLASGIDSAAHRGALAAQGITLAVLSAQQSLPEPRNPAGGGLDQRISPRDSPSAGEFPPAERHHCGLEPGDFGGRSSTPKRLSHHRSAGGLLRPGGIRDSGFDPQSLEPRLPRADPAGRKTDRNSA
jgi:DNA processing protein